MSDPPNGERAKSARFWPLILSVYGHSQQYNYSYVPQCRSVDFVENQSNAGRFLLIDEPLNRADDAFPLRDYPFDGDMLQFFHDCASYSQIKRRCDD